MGKLTLVLGGTKSGKTTWAQNRASTLAVEKGKNVSYIATAQGSDEGMKDRIRKHRASRPAEWITREEPFGVSGMIAGAAEGMSAVILDCLTMLSTNIILHIGEEPERNMAQEAVSHEVNKLLQEIPKITPEVIIISNYVEAGLVAPTYLGGLFQDIVGITHQQIAKQADEVYLLIAGLPQKLK